MIGYIVRRLFTAALVVILTSMIVFAIFFLGPTNPAQPLCDLNGRCTPERLALLTEAMGFNEPVTQQYLEWAKGIFVDREVDMGAIYQCDAPCLGISYSTRTPVTEDLIARFPATLSIAIGGSLIYLTLGVLLGTVAARFRGTATDRGLVTFSVVVSAIPYFVIALLVWIFFSLTWGIFPDTSYTPLTEDPAAWFWGLMLPWLCLGITGSTAYARFTRGQMIESLGEDYVRTAQAKGIKSRKVIVVHALRAAIVPVITIFGLDFAYLLSGTIVTEQIFGIDGIGRWAIEALRAPVDFPVVAATTLFASVLIVIANLLVDIFYSVIDPRVRLT